MSQVWTWLRVAVDNQMKAAHGRTSGLILVYIFCPELAADLFESRPCLVTAAPPAFMMHSAKDIKRRVCPADHRRRWGDGAWSGWCSASGRSRLHIRLCLQKKTNAHVLELGVAAVKRRRFTKTHATLSDKTCSDGENSSACLSSNTINQSTSH